MTIKDDLKAKIIQAGFTMTEVNEKLNGRMGVDRSLAGFSAKLNRESFTYKEVLEIADILGYKIEWQSRENTN